jgi:nitroimidazol reductase NimA-like FMN-containing flavoprotein (pyridoxamine 5'-phosphate oxidase superfamily)
MSSKATTKAARKKRTVSGPRAERARMPAGYGVPKTERGMLSWDQTRRLLERGRSYWLVTIDPDGKPHLVGQWGAWIDDRWYFEGGANTRWARNLAREPRIAMSLEDGTTAVMVEGRAARVPAVERDVSRRITKQYGAKYGRLFKYRPKPEQWDKGGYVLAPHRVFAWDVRGFPRTVTRYTFT